MATKSTEAEKFRLIFSKLDSEYQPERESALEFVVGFLKEKKITFTQMLDTLDASVPRENLERMENRLNEFIAANAEIVRQNERLRVDNAMHWTRNEVLSQRLISLENENKAARDLTARAEKVNTRKNVIIAYSLLTLGAAQAPLGLAALLTVGITHLMIRINDHKREMLKAALGYAYVIPAMIPITVALSWDTGLNFRDAEIFSYNKQINTQCQPEGTFSATAIQRSMWSWKTTQVPINKSAELVGINYQGAIPVSLGFRYTNKETNETHYQNYSDIGQLDEVIDRCKTSWAGVPRIQVAPPAPRR
jgi:hypothetical protein